MRKFILSAAALALGTGIAGAQGDVVNVYNWSDYIDEAVLEQFEAETGIRVVYDVFDSNEVLETKLLAGGTGYDVVVPTGTFLQRQIQAGVFMKLDKSKLPNLEHMWDRIMERIAVYDPGNEHAINYMWGTTGIGYNVDAVEARLGTDTVDSWSVLLDPETLAKFADCGVHFLDAPTELLPAMLNYMGEDPDSKDPEKLRAAAERLNALRPHVKQIHSSAYINALANGDACLVIGWSGDVLQARDRAAEADNDVRVEYSIPKEGALMWFDNMAIPTDAPHPDNAHKFMNFMMRPEVIAAASNYVYYANGNKASQQYLVEDVIDDPAIYPSAETVENLYVVTPYPPQVQRTVTRLWTRFKTGA